MSLESLSVEEKRQLQQAQDAHKLLTDLLTDADPQVRRSAMKLAKKKRPDLRFPEIEAEEAVETAHKATNDRIATLERQLQESEARRLKSEEEAKIRSRGYDPAAVYKLMDTKGVANLDTMLDVLDADAHIGDSTSGNLRPFKNPSEEILKDVKPGERIDVEALRGRLVEQAVGEISGRRVNPLGWLHPPAQSS